MNSVDHTNKNHGKRGAGALDLLQSPLCQSSSASREEGTFTLSTAWAIIRFGQHKLASGWWMLESASADPERAIEVRLTSATNPLITLSNDHNGSRKGAVRIFLPRPEVFDVSLLISPWLGKVKFEKLKLRRLSLLEVGLTLLRSAGRLLKTRDRIGKVSNLIGHYLSGRTVGFRLDAVALLHASTDEPTGLRPTGDKDALKLLRRDGLHILLGAEDALDPRAVQIVLQEFAQAPHLKAIYSDVFEGRTILPRPNREPILGAWFDVAKPPLFFLSDVGAGSLDAETWLQAVVSRWGEAAVGRIPLPLAHRPANLPAELPKVPTPKLTYEPMVSVIIPTKYRIELLAKCLEGLSMRTGYPNLEVVIIDNGSTDERLADVLNAARSRLQLVVIKDARPFNFSRLVNLGVQNSKGEIVLLLNDDVEPIEAGWLHRIVESALAPDVGAVGARLLFPDRTIQHAGVSMGVGGICGHRWKGLSEDGAARNPQIVYPGARMAVTGACLAIRREIFDAVGGFDEESFPVALNDIDFCLRVRALGLNNVYRGDAVLVHHESQSRGDDSISAEKRRRAALETERFLDRWRALTRDDPFDSPEFDQRVESGTVHYSALMRAI